MLLLLLQKLQQISRENKRIDNALNKKNRDCQNSEDVDISRVQRFGEIALHMRPLVWHTNEEVASTLNIDEKDVLQTWFYDNDSDIHCPKFMVFIDHKTESIVLGIRGTYSLRDLAMDLVSDSVPYLDGWAHRGILGGARKILHESKNVLQTALSLFPNYNLVICGHSLGGGAAELITLELLYGEENEHNRFARNGTKITCYAFGAPPVFISNGVTVPFEVPEIKVFVNQADVVPTLSLATVAKAVAQISALDTLELNFLEKSQLMFHTIFSDLEINWSLIRDSVAQNAESILQIDDFQTNFVSFSEMFLEQFYTESKKEAKSFQMESETNIKMRKVVNDTLLEEDCDEISWILKDDGSWNTTFLANEGISFNNDSTIHETDASSTEKTTSQSIHSTDGKIAKALETIKAVKDDDTYVFLRHPGVLYHMDWSIQDGTNSDVSCNNINLQRFSTQESVSYTRSIRLDVVNMVIDHLPFGYDNALNNLS